MQIAQRIRAESLSTGANESSAISHGQTAPPANAAGVRSVFSSHSAKSDGRQRRSQPSYTRIACFPIVAALRCRLSLLHYESGHCICVKLSALQARPAAGWLYRGGLTEAVRWRLSDRRVLRDLRQVLAHQPARTSETQRGRCSIPREQISDRQKQLPGATLYRLRLAEALWRLTVTRAGRSGKSIAIPAPLSIPGTMTTEPPCS